MAPRNANPGDERTVVPNGRRIKQLRMAAGLSQEDLVAGIDLSVRRLSSIENRNESVFPRTLHAIADKLNATKKLKATVTYEELLLNSANADGSTASAPFAKRLFQLPAPLVDFTGRAEQLAHIAARLRGNAGSVGLSSAFRGMGGVGKTTLAIEVAHEVKDHFPDAQLVVDLQGTGERPLPPTEAMARLIRDFHPEAAKLPETEAEMLPVYRRVLAGKRALILLDNAKDEAQVKGLLTASPPVAFLVTSRHALAVDGVESVRVDVLPPDEALALLRHILPTKGTDAELRTVAELCGRLPLALRVAGDFLRLHDNWTLGRYTEALRDEATRLARLKGKTPDRDVEAVLALSARELVRENPERAERWQMLTVLLADFDEQAAAIVWDMTKGSGDAAKPDADAALLELTELLSRSLVQFRDGRYELHDLIRLVARVAFKYVDDHPFQERAEKRTADAKKRHDEYVQIAYAATNEMQNLILKGKIAVEQSTEQIAHYTDALGHAIRALNVYQSIGDTYYPPGVRVHVVFLQQQIDANTERAEAYRDSAYVEEGKKQYGKALSDAEISLRLAVVIRPQPNWVGKLLYDKNSWAKIDIESNDKKRKEASALQEMAYQLHKDNKLDDAIKTMRQARAIAATMYTEKHACIVVIDDVIHDWLDELN